MKSFLRKTLLFLFPVFSILVTFEIILEKLPNNYSYKKNYLDKNSNKIKVLFLGNSHIYYGVNPQFINQRSFNAAYVSQSVNCDYAILKKYEDHFDSLKYIFLPIDYFSLYNTIEYGSESFRVKNYFNYYRILLDGYFPNSLELFYGTINDNIKRIWRVYNRNKLDIFSDRSCNYLGWGDWGLPDKNLVISGKVAANRQKIDSHGFLNKNLDVYNKIIQFTKEKNILLILYTLPFHKYYIKEFKKNEFNKINEIGKAFGNENPNVIYYDFSADTSFKDEDFYDGDHLNDRGSLKFTLKIDSLLKNNFNQKKYAH